MNKFLRNCMTAGVLALGLAACGDDVTVTQPPAPPAVPNITSFSVAPAAVTLTVGQVVQASYNLQLAPGLTGTVAYISGTSSVATIDATGKITAVAVGTSVVTATATSGGQTSVATIGVTVIAAPVVDAIQDFTVSPTSVTMIAGTTTQASYNLQLAPGLSGAVAWGPSTVPAVATINASGVISAVAPGTTSIPVTATSAGQTSTVTIGVTVVAVTPASISIASVTQGLLTLPVNLSNVNGQIEINLNFSPGGQQIDSIVSYIGTKRAAVQAYSASSIPAGGIISMSVNTANFRKNFSQAGVATAGATQVDFLNGPTTVNAIVYPKATTGGSAGNCTNAPPGVAAVCSSNTFSIVLNNSDSWAADMTKPTNTALTATPAVTYWGGPAAAGVVTATLYPVIYTPGRSMTSVTWGIGGCGTVTQGTLPYTQSWGYSAPANNDCTGYEWTGGIRDNAFVTTGIDNAANPIAPFAGLIPNAVVFNSTPDSIRLDYATPSVGSLPIVAGAEGYNWINAAWALSGASATDAGVGMPASPVYNRYATGTSTPTVATGADFAETNTNIATDGYRVYFTTVDRLGNMVTSGNTAYFGVDKTNPAIRYSATAAPSSFAAIYTSGGSTAVTDSTTYAAFVGQYGANVATVGAVETYLAVAAGTNDNFRTESIDNRSGLSRSIVTSRRFAQGGATGTTANTGCQTASGAFGAALIDGWRPAPAVHVTCASATAGYYTTSETTVDRAGNTSGTYKRTLALDPAQPQVTGVSPNANYVGNAAANFTIGTQDDLEAVDARVRLTYANVLQGDVALTAANGLVWNYGSSPAFASRFDNLIVNPFLGALSIDAFTVSVQETDPAAAATNGDPSGVAPVKPDFVNVMVRDVFGSFSNNFTAGAATGVSAEFSSPILSATVPAVGTYTVAKDGSTNCPAGGIVGGPCVTSGLNFRAYSVVSTTRTFRATEALSVTLPMFTRVDLFGLNAANEWVYIQRITVPASVPTSGSIAAGAGTITGSDNGFERYWDYAFTNVPTGYSFYRALGVRASGHGLFSTRN